MNNSLKKLQEEREAMLPPDIEFRITRQVDTFSFFGKVVELFLPNALDTATKMIGGESYKPNADDWRNAPKKQ